MVLESQYDGTDYRCMRSLMAEISNLEHIHITQSVKFHSRHIERRCVAVSPSTLRLTVSESLPTMLLAAQVKV